MSALVRAAGGSIWCPLDPTESERAKLERAPSDICRYVRRKHAPNANRWPRPHLQAVFGGQNWFIA